MLLSFKRTLALALALVFAITCLSSCAPNNKCVVGSVGEFEVPYEELYFLSSTYKGSLEAKYGEYDSLDAESAKQFDEELSELVYSNIVVNYAILSLCADEGLTLDGDGVDDRVDDYIDTLVATSFGSSKSDYKKSLKQFGLTDSYVRFTAAVDILYSDLMAKLLEESKIEDDDEKIKEIVKNEFARTWHIMITNDMGESVEENRAKAEEALSKYRDGSMSMYNLIGSVYNEDLSLTELDGFYFARGSMDEIYEDVAFSLEVGEVSEVFETIGTNSLGQTVSAFYIIQRLEIEDEYVENNLSDLKQKYINSVIYNMLEQKKETLEFEPNEFLAGLSLADLSAPSTTGTVVVVVGGLASLAVATVAIVVFVLRKKKK